MTDAKRVNAGDRRTIIGAFADRSRAEAALRALDAANFPTDRRSLIVRDDQSDAASDSSELVGEGAAGALTGGMLGGLAGLLVGVSSLVLPGIGPIVGAGIILAALAGAGIGAAAGGLIGALADVGVPEDEARAYEAQLLGGQILLTAHAEDDTEARAAYAIMVDAGGSDVRAYGTGAAQTPMAAIGRPAIGTATDMATPTEALAGTRTATRQAIPVGDPARGERQLA